MFRKSLWVFVRIAGTTALLFMVACAGTASGIVAGTVTPTGIATATSGQVAVATPVATRSTAQSPTPSVSQPPPGPTVTLANDRQTLTLAVGQRFLLDLGSGYDWTVDVADQHVVSRVVNVMVIRGAQGLYEARQPGETTLRATGDAPCRKAKPPCMLPSRLFTITIVVMGTGAQGTPTPAAANATPSPTSTPR